MNMPIEMNKDIEKARLLWRCRRGMLELDLLLQRFMQQAYDQLTSEQLLTFKKILQEQDPDLFSWLMGHTIPDSIEYQEFVTWFRQHYCYAK